MVAILIHETSQWSEALRTGKALSGTGATVTLFFLGYAPMSIANPLLDDLCIACYTDTRQQGMDCLPLNEIAEMLKQYDLVITI